VSIQIALKRRKEKPTPLKIPPLGVERGGKDTLPPNAKDSTSKQKI
jgi:hypothetical protein